MKHLLLFVALLISFLSAAQSFGEVEIEGNIKVPKEADPNGITIYNKNTGRGSVSSREGNFTIYVKLNDSLYFSGLQYRDLLVVVDEQTIKSRTLHVEITEDVNELAEVTVRPHDLTGNLDADTGNIETVKLNLPVMSAMSINDHDWEWRPDGQTAVTNAAMPSGGLQYGADPLAILGGIVSLVLPPRERKEKPPSPRNKIGIIKLQKEIRSRFDNEFFEEVLGIPIPKISDFIHFLDAGGFSSKLLEEHQELDLIELMVNKSQEYKEL